MNSGSFPALAAAVAPGLWAAVLVAALCLVLAHWYDRVPRPVLAAFAVVVLLFFGEVLLGGAVLLPLDNLRGEPPFRHLPAAEPHGNLLQGDLLYLVHPLRLEVRRSLAAGAWPLWAPTIGAGLPLLANPQSQALQPLAAAGLALEPLSAPAAVAALRTFVALVFSYLLLARLGAARGPALAGALAYGLGGFLQLWLGWPLANTAALLPAVLYGVTLAADRGYRRDWGLATLTLAALLLAGHPETIAYSLLLAVALFLARLCEKPSPERLRFFARSAGAAAVALCLAAPALLPAADHLPHTLRWSRWSPPATASAPAPADTAGAGTTAPATRLVQAAAPNALGNDRFAHYWGLANSNEDAAGFVSTAALLAALLALPGWLRGPRPLRHEGMALALAAACTVLLALPPGALGLVPADAVSGRLALPLGLCLALLAAATLERFRRRELPRGIGWVGLPVVAGLLALLHLWAVPALVHPDEPETLAVLREGWLHWHLRFLAAAAVVLLVGRRRRWAAWAVAGLVAAELFLAHRPVNPPMPRELAFPETPAVAALRGPSGEPGRIAAVGRAFLPNLGAVYGLRDVRVFDPMAPAQYLALLAPGIGTWHGEIPLLGDPAARGWATYDRLGVGRWILAPEVACPAGTEEVYAGGDARVCRRGEALPVVQVAGPGGVASARELAGGARWQVLLEPPAGGTLETGLYAAPGWRGLADGRPVPLRQAPLLAADLPPDTRRFGLLYRPAPFVAGCLLAGLGLAAALAWLLRPPATPAR